MAMIEWSETDPGSIIVSPEAGLEKVQRTALGGRRSKDGTIRMPATSLTVQRLIDFYGEGVLDGAPDIVRDMVNEPWGFSGWSVPELGEAARHPAWSKLYPFQREAVEYLCCNIHGSALLALSPGLGKSAVSVVAADLLDHERVLVLAPVSLTFNWQREIEMWSDRRRSVHRATAKNRAPAPTGITVANHEVVQEVVLRDETGELAMPPWSAADARRAKKWIEAGPTRLDPSTGKMVPARERVVRVRRDYRDTDWDLIIVDESILLKNRKARRTDVLKTLTAASPNADVWMLSGSPTAKYRDDLFRQLQIMAPKAFTSYWRFTEFFCVVEKGQWGWKVIGDQPGVDPHAYLRDYLFVRSQDQVLKELPDYVYRDIDIEASPRQRRALDKMLDEWIAVLEEAPDDPVVASTWLAMLTRLQQITSDTGSLPKDDGSWHQPGSAKRNLLIDLIRSQEVELPLLVWTWYVRTTELVAKGLGKLNLRVGAVSGSTDTRERDRILQAYKAGDLDVLVLQMGVGKFGHTLTNTQTVYYHDRAFDSDAWVQSLRRVKRIGLEHRPTLIVPRIVNSADELIDENLAGKLKSVANLTNTDLASLLARQRHA